MANIRIGSQLDIGSAWSTPSRSRPQPHWNTAVTTPYAAPTLSRFIRAAFTATTGERNISRSSSIETPTTKPITSQTLSARMLEKSAYSALEPASSAPSGSWARSDATCSGVRASLSANVDSALTTATPPSGETTGVGDVHQVVPGLQVGHDRRHLGVGEHRPVGDHQVRRRRAGSERVGQQVVGLAGLARGGVVAAALRPGPHVEHGSGEQQHHGHRGEGPGQRPGGHPVRPALGPRRALADVGGSSAAHAPRQQPTVQEAAEGRHQHEGADHDREDRDGRGEPERRVGRQARQPEAEQRDEHRRAGEHDRAARGDGRPLGRLDDGETGGQVVAGPGQQQQRVVDADPEPDHRGHHRGVGAHVHHAAEDGDARAAHGEPAHGDEDREAGGHDRAEHQQQDRQGRDDADQLAGAPDLALRPSPAARRRARPAARRRGSAPPPPPEARRDPSGRGA